MDTNENNELPKKHQRFFSKEEAKVAKEILEEAFTPEEQSNSDKIFERYEDLIVEEEVPDIRSVERPYDSGAESFFCNLTVCKKEQDVLRGIAGLKTNEDRVEELLNSKAKNYFDGLKEKEELEKRLKENKADIEALLMVLNYDEIKWTEKTLRASKPSRLFLFPSWDKSNSFVL